MNSLTPEEFANRTPKDPKASIEHWPFPDIPIDPHREVMTSLQLLRLGGGLVRISGLIGNPYPDTPESKLRVLVGGMGIIDSTTLDIALDTPAPYRQLAGLDIDVSVLLDPNEEGTENLWRSSRLHSVHGIREPLQAGDQNGIARGIVESVHLSNTNPTLSHGMQLYTGDTTLRVA